MGGVVHQVSGEAERMIDGAQECLSVPARRAQVGDHLRCRARAFVGGRSRGSSLVPLTPRSEAVRDRLDSERQDRRARHLTKVTRNSDREKPRRMTLAHPPGARIAERLPFSPDRRYRPSLKRQKLNRVPCPPTHQSDPPEMRAGRGSPCRESPRAGPGAGAPNGRGAPNL